MNLIYIVVAVVIIVAAAVAYIFINRKPAQTKILPKDCEIIIQPENISVNEGTVSMIEVVEWFKNLPLDKNIHTPFIATQDLLRKLSPNTNFPSEKQLILMGVLNEKEAVVEFVQVICGDTLSVDLKSTIGDEQIIVLS